MNRVLEKDIYGFADMSCYFNPPAEPKSAYSSTTYSRIAQRIQVIAQRIQVIAQRIQVIAQRIQVIAQTYSSDSITSPSILLTKDEIMNSESIHIDGHIDLLYANVHGLSTASKLPPILLIAGGVPFMIIIPLCILRYPIAPETMAADDATMATDDENKKAIKGTYKDAHGNTITFYCTAKVSDDEGCIELQGRISADGNVNQKSLVAQLFSQCGVGRNNDAGNISVVSAKLFAIDGATGAEGEGSCDHISGDCHNKTRAKKMADDYEIKQRARKQSQSPLLSFKRKKLKNELSQSQSQLEKPRCNTAQTMPESLDLEDLNEQMEELRLVDNNRDKEELQTCGGETISMANEETKKVKNKLKLTKHGEQSSE
ncbi:MAG: hypothetical protein QS748_14340 [Candidatus Endonucleobacter bathymodioli]|uniref:Uncharacterized protein n=1 Tax=Candidatus Endonucleibacter bathymodioli TaxID=539814 RepID=A0AA90SU40_9GAMM|nr:hypothetical protein [Candidatus Endonucleobacter bathymodioli]